VRTTEGDDCSYDEPTNCRLREDTNASMMFGLNQNSTPVMLNQISIQVKPSDSGKKVNNKATPAKVTPIDK